MKPVETEKSSKTEPGLAGAGGLTSDSPGLRLAATGTVTDPGQPESLAVPWLVP